MQQKQNGVFRHAAFTKLTKPIKHLLTSGLTEDFDTEFLYNRFNSQALAAGCSFCNPLKKKKKQRQKTRQIQHEVINWTWEENTRAQHCQERHTQNL